MEFAVYKNPDYYTSKHNAYMMTAIRNYPGITVTHETDDRLFIKADGDAADFLRHMSDCDLIAMD